LAACYADDIIATLREPFVVLGTSIAAGHAQLSFRVEWPSLPPFGWRRLDRFPVVASALLGRGFGLRLLGVLFWLLVLLVVLLAVVTFTHDNLDDFS
jgi:hypothetical protein